MDNNFDAFEITVKISDEIAALKFVLLFVTD
jgi:hypothetical protein